jgi:putative phosphoribosyl transferase
VFENRVDAGRQLAARLEKFREDDVVVVGLPRGGVPVAREVALWLQAPLDVILVRKLGIPLRPEYAMGAIGEGDARVLNEQAISNFAISPAEIAEVERRERVELDRRAQAYRAVQERTPLAGRVVLIVDDGIATGSTARAACQVARASGAERVVLAVPVAPAGWDEDAREVADEFIAVTMPRWFQAVGQFYRDFDPTTDHDVIACLESMPDPAPASQTHNAQSVPRDLEIEIPIGSVMLQGRLVVPDDARGIVVFAHGSGSSRHSPRNQFVASILNGAGLATLLFDLLTPNEEAIRSNVFDIDLLGQRLDAAAKHLRSYDDLARLDLGFFGASTGAAAALYAAAQPASGVSAVVSRGGRPDLAGDRLATVEAPTLLIVGDRDQQVLELNRIAQSQMSCTTRLLTVPGATHLFEEPGTLRIAADLAAEWFVTHLGRSK